MQSVHTDQHYQLGGLYAAGNGDDNGKGSIKGNNRALDFAQIGSSLSNASKGNHIFCT